MSEPRYWIEQDRYGLPRYWIEQDRYGLLSMMCSRDGEVRAIRTGAELVDLEAWIEMDSEDREGEMAALERWKAEHADG